MSYAQKKKAIKQVDPLIVLTSLDAVIFVYIKKYENNGITAPLTKYTGKLNQYNTLK